MNKALILKVLSATGTVLGTAGGIAAYNDILPQKWLPYAVVLGTVSVSLHKVVTTLGDLLDDGQLNDSFKN